MRHVIGFALAVALAAAIFFGAAWGYLRLLKIPVVNGGAATAFTPATFLDGKGRVRFNDTGAEESLLILLTRLQ